MSALVQAIGQALLHLVWQGALVAVALAVALRALPERAARLRYALACAALLAMAALPVVTAALCYQPHTDVAGSEPAALSWAASSAGPALVAVGADDPAKASLLQGLLAAAAAAVVRWSDRIVLVWALGVLLGSARVLAGWLRLVRLVRAAEPAGPEWQAALSRLCAVLGVDRPVRLLASRLVEVPSAVGFLRPVVLVPLSVLSGLPSPQLELVLAHELAHIRRHDYLVNLLQTAVETVLFHHPAVWWIGGVIRAERENCCDDLALSTGATPLSYARALTALESLRALPSPALSALGGSLPARVQRLLLPGVRCSSSFSVGASVAAVVLGLSLALPLAAEALPDAVALASSPAAQDDAAAGFAAAGGLPVAGPSRVTPRKARARSSATAPLAPSAPSAPSAPAAPAAPSAPAAVAAPVAPPAPAAVAALPAPAPFAAPAMPSAPAAMAAPVAPVAPMAWSPLAAPTPPPSPAPFALAAAPRPAPTPAPSPRPQAVAAGSDEESDDEDAPADKERVVGRDQLTVDDLVSLRNAGIDGTRVRELRSLGFEPTVRSLVSLGHAGVTAASLKALRDLFGESLLLSEVISMHHVGVDADYLRGLAALGFKSVTPRQAISARATGVTVEYARELQEAGFEVKDLDQLIRLRSMGVTAAWVKELKAAGVASLSLEELQQLRAVGVDGAYVRKLRDAGLAKLTAAELRRLKAGGVTPEYLEQLRGP